MTVASEKNRPFWRIDDQLVAGMTPTTGLTRTLPNTCVVTFEQEYFYGPAAA